MAKILFVKGDISSYNVPVYNKIAQYHDLCVGYYNNNNAKSDCLFKTIHLEAYKIGPIVFVKHLSNIIKKFDVIIQLNDLHNINSSALSIFKRKYRIISWSIGFRVSYKHPYLVDRRHNLLDSLYLKLLNSCDANIFYMSKALEFWKDTDLNTSKVFIAPNTTDVIKIVINPKIKKDFVFIGTLYKGKGVDLLIKMYSKVASLYSNCPKLIIIGDGAERKQLEASVQQKNLCDKIIFTGAIYKETELAKIFTHALLCFSPNQAGLSVLKSMGYGVPFVTKYDAITGGEIYHISPDVNGIKYDKDSDLYNIMQDSINNPQKYINMGIKAYQYYYCNATVQHMANGALDAIDYVLRKG
jgi:glycosyltransferase involved in cell wall biosynthesis